MEKISYKYNILKLALLFVLLPSLSGVGGIYVSLCTDGDNNSYDNIYLALNADSTSSAFVFLDDDDGDDDFVFISRLSSILYANEQSFKYNLEDSYLEWFHHNLFCFSDSSPPSC